MYIKTKANIVHLVITLILSLGLTFIIMRYIAIILIWFYVGDGAYPKSLETYLNISYGLSATIFLFPVLIYRIRANYKKENFSKVINYCLAGVFIIILSILLYKEYV